MRAAIPQRFTALDVFRGITVCFMIIVNTPGDGAITFAPLLHAQWHGFTPTDLVFPSFLFAVGNAMAFVMQKWKTWSNAAVVKKIFKRTLIIFLLGYLMYWFPFVKWDNESIVAAPFADTRVFGVLQRIALCYGFAGLIIWFLGDRASLAISIIMLLTYWGSLYLFTDTGDPLGMQTNTGYLLDNWLIGERHMYRGEGVAFDPEGLLSTLPAIVNVIAGYLAGRFILKEGLNYKMLSRLLLTGFLLLFIAYCWNFFLPINKKLWTPSFVTITVGLDLIIIGGIIYLVDFLHYKSANYFFEVFGRNPLFIYLLSELLAILLWFFRVGDQPLYQWIYYRFFVFAGDYWGSLFFALSFMVLCWLMGYWLDKRRIYIRV